MNISNQEAHVGNSANAEVVAAWPEEERSALSWVDHAIAAEAWERQHEAEWAAAAQRSPQDAGALPGLIHEASSTANPGVPPVLERPLVPTARPAPASRPVPRGTDPITRDERRNGATGDGTAHSVG